ncbi:hypothetical protein SK128_017663, partial [Halocaridina rubra]
MLGDCIPVTSSVSRPFFFLPLSTLALCVLLPILLPSATHARALQQQQQQREELEGSPVLSLILPRVSLGFEDEDLLPFV